MNREAFISLVVALPAAAQIMSMSGNVMGQVHSGPDSRSCQNSPRVSDRPIGILAISTRTGWTIPAVTFDGEIRLQGLQRYGAQNWEIKVDKPLIQRSVNIYDPTGASHAGLLTEKIVCFDEAIPTQRTPFPVPPQPLSYRRLSPFVRMLVSPGPYFENPQQPDPVLSGIVFDSDSPHKKGVQATLKLFGIDTDKNILVPQPDPVATAQGEFHIAWSAQLKKYSRFLITAESETAGYGSRLVSQDDWANPHNDLTLRKAPQQHLPTYVDLASPERGGLALALQLTRLPLPAERSFDRLALLAPGVMLPAATFSASGPGLAPGVGTAGQFVVNGLRSRENNFTFDGSDNNDEEVGARRQGFVVAIPQPLESMSEFQVKTALTDSEFGRNIGGQVDVLSDAGQPLFHGTVYGFLTDHRVNAHNFFDSSVQPGAAALTRQSDNAPVTLDGKPLFVSNPVTRESPSTSSKLGATVSGPLTRSRNPKTFFLAAIEAQQTRASQQEHFAVPTVAQRGFANLGDRGIPATNPFNLTGAAAFPDSIAGDAVFSLFPFPNNPSGPYGNNTYTAVLPADANSVAGAGKLDRYFHRRWNHEFVARYNGTDEDSILPVTGGALYSSLRPKVRTNNIASFFNTTAPRWVNSFRFSFGTTNFRFDEVRDPSLVSSTQFPNTGFLLNKPLLLNETLPASAGPAYVTAPAASGLSNIPQTTDQVTGPVGEIQVAGFSPLGVDVNHFPQHRWDRTFQWADTIATMRGRHNIHLGFDLLYMRINSDLARNAFPEMDFYGQRSQSLIPSNLPQTGPPTPLIDPASFVAMGAPAAIRQTFATSADNSLRLHRKQIGLFAHDEVQWLPNLHVNFGLRFNLNRMPESSDGRFEKDFDRQAFDTQLAAASAACNSLPGDTPNPFGGVFPGTQDACKQSLQNVSLAFPPGFTSVFGANPFSFDPRFGFAWDPSNRGTWVLRGGWGLYSGQFPAIILNESRNAFPRFVPLAYASQEESGRIFNLANPYFKPSGPGTPNGGVAPNSLFGFDPTSINGLLPSSNPVSLVAQNLLDVITRLEPVQTGPGFKNPYSMQFGLTLEHEIAGQYFVSAAYVGTQGRRLLRLTEPDPIGPPMPSLYGFLGAGVPQFLVTRVVRSATDPYFFDTVVSRTLFSSSASSSYHSLQLESHGRNRTADLQFGGAFTYAHVIDDASDFFDLAGAFARPQDGSHGSERGPSNFDSRLRLAGYFLWNVPQWRALRWTAGWRISGVLAAQTGQPFTVNTVYDVNQDGNLTDRLDNTDGLLQMYNSDRRVRLQLSDAPGFESSRLLSAQEAAIGQYGCVPTQAPPRGTGTALCDGAVGRNTFRAAGISTLDLALTKTFPVRERTNVLLRAEAFNAFNRTNYAIPVRILEAPAFGTSVATSTPNRILRLALKFQF